VRLPGQGGHPISTGAILPTHQICSTCRVAKMPPLQEQLMNIAKRVRKRYLCSRS